MTIRSRHHVELVHGDRVIPKPHDADLTPGRRVRVLSSGDVADATTALVTYPPGWTTPRAGSFDQQLEVFVRHGVLRVNGIDLSRHSYAFIPPGLPVHLAASPEGAEVLTFHEGRAIGDDTNVDERLTIGDGEIAVVHAADVDWAPSASPGLPGGLAFKRLHFDSVTQQRTTLLAGPPGWDSRLHEFHPCAEEAFCLEGDITMDHLDPPDCMSSGDYFWRPPFLSHGPMRTLHGFLLVLRTDGRHVNHLSTWRIDPETARRIDLLYPDGLRP